MPITKAEGKKDGKQKYRVRINYTDINGNHKQIERTAYGANEAKALEYKLQKELSFDASLSLQSMTIQALYEDYIRAKKTQVRETSLDKAKNEEESELGKKIFAQLQENLEIAEMEIRDQQQTSIYNNEAKYLS